MPNSAFLIQNVSSAPLAGVGRNEGYRAAADRSASNYYILSLLFFLYAM